MRAKKLKIKEEDLVRRYQDLLEIARLVSWCMNRDHLIKTCLDHTLAKDWESEPDTSSWKVTS